VSNTVLPHVDGLAGLFNLLVKVVANDSMDETEFKKLQVYLSAEVPEEEWQQAKDYLKHVADSNPDNADLVSQLRKLAAGVKPPQSLLEDANEMLADFLGWMESSKSTKPLTDAERLARAKEINLIGGDQAREIARNWIGQTPSIARLTKFSQLETELPSNSPVAVEVRAAVAWYNKAQKEHNSRLGIDS